MSIVGMASLMGIAFLLSKNKRAINLRTVCGAFALQFIFGGFVLYTSIGKSALESVTYGVQSIIDYGSKGIDFLFGGLT